MIDRKERKEGGRQVGRKERRLGRKERKREEERRKE
jgi:hypothetical protein